MDYFSNVRFEQEEKRQNAFALVKALREALTIAKKAPQPITYEQAIEMVYDIDSDLYQHISSLLINRNESDLVKYFKEKAESLSEPGTIFQYTPEKLIQDELDEHHKIINNSVNQDKKRFLKRRVLQLKAALDYFKPRRVSEHKILEHDYFMSNNISLLGDQLYGNHQYKDYKLEDKRILRMRLLHPDKEEHILGADLIYEIFDLKNDRVRFAHLQYKTWEKGVLYLKHGNIKDQLVKMNGNLCKTGFCQDVNKNKFPDNYRLPYCSGFLRPTNKLQNLDSKLVSSGIHIPICEVMKYLVDEGKLTKTNVRGNNISSKNFTDLFVNNLLGSRWVQISTLEKFYEERGIDTLSNKLRVHAQEILLEGFVSDELR